MHSPRAADVHRHPEDWPQWVPVLAAGIATTAVYTAFVYRMQEHQSVGRVLLYAAVALSPFMLDVVDLVTPFRVSLPLWAFPIPVLIGGALLVSQPTEVDFAPFIFVFVTAEVTSRSGEATSRWLGVATWLASIAIMVGFDIWGRYDDSFVWVIGISFGWFGGFLIQSLYAKTHELREAQAGLAQKAAGDERQRIAREVHDVIAHSMSVTMLHVTAARMALERGQSPQALEALREAEHQGRNSLNDIRRTVGLLGPDESAATPPMPTATDLRKLVADFKGAGLDVELSMTGDVDALPPGAGLNLYRIAQESLTNVAKHAPGAKARVELFVTEDDVRLRVHNTPGNGDKPIAADGGRGLRGINERADLLGGALSVGPDGDGWTVAVSAPRLAEA